jgi:hypothetical protein
LRVHELQQPDNFLNLSFSFHLFLLYKKFFIIADFALIPLPANGTIDYNIAPASAAPLPGL